MAEQFPSNYDASTTYYLPIHASMIPYLAGALASWENSALWLNDSEYALAYNAIAQVKTIMAQIQKIDANSVLAGPTSGTPAPAAYRKLVASDLPQLLYSSLVGTPTSFNPTLHKATHASGGSDAITPANIGAADAIHSHSVAYGSLTGIPASFTPSAHNFKHMTGGVDPLTPANIGAADVNHAHAVEAWQTPAFLNSWSNYGAGYNSAGYFKDTNGVVHLRGLVKHAAPTANQTIFILPSGYRPIASELFIVGTYTTSLIAGRIDIDIAGNVIFRQGNGTFMQLDGLTFRAV